MKKKRPDPTDPPPTRQKTEIVSPPKPTPPKPPQK